jgi:hypothetical protein
MKKMNSVTFAIMAAGLLCIGLMSGAGASAADKDACSDDVAKFCQNIEPGTIALMDCLEKHENELTDACKAQEMSMDRARVERRERLGEWKQFRQACQKDMAMFCNDAVAAHGGMIKCLNDHQKEISVSCSESVKAIVD